MPFQIDPDSPIPIYHQLKSALKNQIETGELGPGERIPTEQDLCARYGISRTPVRQALQELVYEGLLVRRRGRGTFVADQAGALTSPATSMRLLTSDSRWAALIARATDRWNRKNPHRQVNLHTQIVDHTDLHRTLTASVAEGTAPDVSMIDHVWIAEFAQAGFLFSLDELDADWTHQYAQDLCPAFAEANYYDGHFYGLQLEADVSVLWYRKDWFLAEGLHPPTDWNELLSVAQHFSLPDVRERFGHTHALIFPGGRTGGEATVYSLLPFLWSAGGNVFSNGQVCLDSAANHSAVRFIGELVTQHAVVPPEVVTWKPRNIPRRLARGETAMTLGGSYETQNILQESGWTEAEFLNRIACCLPPASPGREPAATTGGVSYAILRQSRQPQRVMDIFKLATNQDLLAEFGLTACQDSPGPYIRGAFTTHDSPLLANSYLLSAARARPSLPEYFRVSEQLQTMFETVITQTALPEHAVRRAAEFIGAITGQPLR